MATVGSLYSPLAARVRRDLMAAYSGLIFALLFGAAIYLEARGHSWIYSALYVYVEVMGALCIMQFWTLANELFHAREAKRLYGLIGAGGSVANILVGLAIAWVAAHYGASALLWLCAGLCLACGAGAALAGWVGRQRMIARAAQGRSSSAKRAAGASRVFASGHLRAVALLSAATSFTVTVVDFVFKVIARGTLPRDELAAYFGHFNVVIGLLAIGLQLFGTNTLLSRVGVIGALAILPLTLLSGSAVTTLVPLLWAAALTKGADALFRYSVNDATTQILYLPVPSHSRASAKAFIDGVVKPLSIGLSGLFLLGYNAWLKLPAQYLPPFVVVLCLVWTAIVVSLRSQYLRSLQDNLRKKSLGKAETDKKDGTVSPVLLRALESSDPHEVQSALALLPELENLELDRRVEPLLDHALPEIRISALEYYAARKSPRFANSLFKRFEDSDARVRAAAIDAFCALGRDRSLRSVRPFMSDAEPSVRSAAITGMIRYGGLDGVLAAAEALKTLISDKAPAMRENAAKVLGAIGVKNFYQPVLELMGDPEPSVRRAAVEAAGALQSPELTSALLSNLANPETAQEAVEALALQGTSAMPALTRVMGNHLEDLRIRRGVASILGRIGGPDALQTVLLHLGEPDEELRRRLFRSLFRLGKTARLGTSERATVLAALKGELERAFLAITAMELLRLNVSTTLPARRGPASSAALFASALTEKVAEAERRIFWLLAVIYPEADMEGISAGLRDASAGDAGRRRSNAVELLDNLLDRDLKRLLLPLIEDAPRPERLRAVVPLLSVRFPSTAMEMVTLLYRDENAWVRACALHYASEHGLPTPEEQYVAALSDPHAVVRETALVCLTRAFPHRARREAEHRVTDEAPVVRQRAALIAQRQ
ncbi:MAG: Npt1/Npt2 family nucleotide transporter [Myxococcaceae bacterium]